MCVYIYILLRGGLSITAYVYIQRKHRNVRKILYGDEHPLLATVYGEVRRISCTSGLFCGEKNMSHLPRRVFAVDNTKQQTEKKNIH